MPLNISDIVKITKLIEKKLASVVKSKQTRGEITGSEEKISSHDLTEINEELKKRDEKLAEQEQKIAELEAANEKLAAGLEKLLEQHEDQLDTPSSSSIAPVNLDRFEALEKDLANLRHFVDHLKFEPEEVQFDLRNEFDKEVLFATSKLKLDWISKPAQANTLNEVFKSQLKKDPKNPTGLKNYVFPVRAIDQVLTLREWIIPGATKEVNITKFKVSDSLIIDNSFEPWKPKEKQVSLGTGTGKSTLFLRCLAHRNPDGGGATLVVPYSSLVDSVLGAHNKWLSLGRDTMKDDEGNVIPDPDKRVTICPICEESHTAKFDDKGNPIITAGKQEGKYETVKNGYSEMVNVFTWWEFLEAYIDDKRDEATGKSWIKPWVVFDEAHTDTPAYQALIKGLKGKKGRPFKIVEMSATFGSLPTSKKLTGTIENYYINSFASLLKIQPNFFQKKVIVFCDDMSELSLKLLDEQKIKYLILNDSLKDYATDIVRSMKAPLLVFANRDYSVGFSFGDVNVISTGVSRRKIIVDDKGTEKIVGDGKDNKPKGISDFADLLQERGRAARDKKHTAVWASFVPGEGKYVLKDDYAGKTLDDYFKKSKIDENDKEVLKKIIALFSKEKKPIDLDEEKGRQNLYKILVADLKDNLDPDKLFTIKHSEKGKFDEKDKPIIDKDTGRQEGKREYGEYIFESDLMKYFQEKDLFDLLVLATEDKIKDFSQSYDWFKTEDDPDDDYIFGNEADVKPFGFYFQARKQCEVVKPKQGFKGSKKQLILKFKPYKFDKKKLQAQVQAQIEVPPRTN